MIVALLTADLVYIDRFNATVHEVSGNAEDEATRLFIDTRENTTISWVKQNFDLGGVVYNDAPYEIDDRCFTLQIKNDCLINQAWCGTMEIHQHAGTAGDKVQTLDLRNYDADRVTLDHYYDGDF